MTNNWKAIKAMLKTRREGTDAMRSSASQSRTHICQDLPSTKYKDCYRLYSQVSDPMLKPAIKGYNIQPFYPILIYTHVKSFYAPTQTKLADI